MWNTVITGVKVKNESSGLHSILPLQGHCKQNYKTLLLKHYFDKWKSFGKHKPTVEHSRKKKEIVCTKFNQQKKISCGTWNRIDLNKILLQNEVDQLKRFWGAWKEAVINKSCLQKTNIKAKGKCFQKPNQVVAQSLSGVHCTVINKLYRDENCDTKKKYFNMWRENTQSLLQPESTAMLEKNINYFIYPEKMKTLDTTCVSDSKCTNEENTGIWMLRHYFNMWRAAKNNSPLIKNFKDVHTSKIENFLTAVRAAKMKTAKKLKSNHSILHGSHPKRRKSHYDSLKMSQKSKGVQDNQSPLRANTNKLLDSRDSTSSETISSIKKEVNMSLEEAQSLLESTIAASYRGNCAKRKVFKQCNRKGSPLPPEMPAGDILDRMKMRELERAARWQQSRERKERLENERMMKILEKEKEKVKMQELSKKQKLQEAKEKKMEKVHQEKYLEEIRQKYCQLNLKALKHYNVKLLLMGLKSFVNEVNTTAALESQASTHYEKMLVWTKFNDWKNATNQNSERRISSAVEFHQRILLRLYFINWHKLQQEYILNKQAATDFCDMRTQEKAFQQWNQYTCDMMIEMNLRAEIADIFYTRYLLKKSLHYWRRLPSVMESERARERIKNSFRMKVLEIFPDFCPQLEDDS